MKQVGAVVTAVAVLGLAGCAGDSGATPEAPPSEKPGSALAKLDTCRIMTQQQLQSGGFTFDGRRKNIDAEPGCAHVSESIGLVLYKNQEQTVDSYKENGSWSEYVPIQVNDRSGARARVPGATENMCSTLISAGGGVVMVSVQSADPRTPIDGCAESLRIAKRIEPNLPE